jgi:predicted Zn finger-like uncharacterized protein
MFTVCPKCTLTLVVTTVDLRAGQGYVRCGRCANVFNALIALREGDPAAGLAQTAPPPSTQPALGAGVAMELEPEPPPEPEPEPEAEPFADAEILLEAETAHEPESGFMSEETSLEFDAAATDVSEIFVSPTEAEHGAGSGNYEAVVLGDEASEPFVEGTVLEFIDDPSHTDTITADEWSLLDDEPAADAESVIEESPLVVPRSRAATDEASQNDPAWVEEMFAEAEAEAERARTSERETLTQEPDPAPADEAVEEEESDFVHVARASKDAAPPTETVLEPLLAEPAPKRPRWQYSAGIAGLVLLLAIQVLHSNRQGLLLNGTVGPLLAKVYGWFDVSLTPRWDLTAYSVKQLGANAEGSEGSRLSVRLSLQNDSERVQPMPLLRLTLQDRYGNAVATRDLEPADYLPPAVAGRRLLEPDQRIDAELHVVDPGRAASNFEIDACLRGEGGVVGCASDAPRRKTG